MSNKEEINSWHLVNKLLGTMDLVRILLLFTISLYTSVFSSSASHLPQQRPNNTMDPEPNSHPDTSMFSLLDDSYVNQIRTRYAEERLRRLHPKGNAQYADLELDPDIETETTSYISIDNDDFPACEEFKNDTDNIPEIDHQRIVIVGAGFGGLLNAVRLLQTGDFEPKNILFLDAASGFGGTWCWNEYPGLMCDIESYIYMPLLEETGYMPSHKYVSGVEIKEHAYRIARMYGLYHRALLCTSVSSLVWDEHEMNWTVKAVQHRHQGIFPLTFSADFVILTANPVSIPKLPNIDGISDFQGKKFHTARWDYKVTGGSADLPVLQKLRDKKVAIIGTGATAVQAIPHLAEWSRKLYVFQRTPSAVDRRDNCPTEPQWWAGVVSQGPGWQAKRMENFNHFISNAPNLPDIDLVNDEWSRARSYSALVGGPQNRKPGYLKEMEMVDLLRQDKIRNRVSQVVERKKTADLLKPWYSGWCKRPCFHDEYLQAFNNPNVELIDTNGKGVVCVTQKGVVTNQIEYEVDVLIFATGYNASGRTTPDARSDMFISGRGQKSMRMAWKDGVATLHGLMTRDFPNLFFPGPNQAGITANYTYFLDQMAKHVSYIISNATKKQGPYKVTIEPSVKGQEAWSREVMIRAGGLAGMANCTPGYLNMEGEFDSPKAPEEIVKAARAMHWAEGVMSWVKIVEGWREKGGMEGLEVKRLKKIIVDE